MSEFIARNKQKLQIGLVVTTSILVVLGLARINTPTNTVATSTTNTTTTSSDDSNNQVSDPATNDSSDNEPSGPEINESEPTTQEDELETDSETTTARSTTQQETNDSSTSAVTQQSASADSTSSDTESATTSNPEDDEPAPTTEPTSTSIEATSTSNEQTTTNSQPTKVSGVVWSEEFNSLDTSRWALEDNSNFGVNEDQCYLARNVSVRDGKLVLVGKNEDVTCKDGPRTQTSGMIRGQDFSFSPGQAIEFRVKLTPADQNNQAGLFPAVWSSGWAGPWPLGGEFDFLEVMTANNPTRPFFSMHHQDPSGQHVVNNKFFKLGENFTNDWHTVRVEYRTGDLRWFINGNLAHTVNQANTAQGWPAPFDRTIRDLRINLALGGRPGPLDPRALGTEGATFEMDYIRVSNL